MDWIDYWSGFQFKRFAIQSIILMSTRNVIEKREEPHSKYAVRGKKAVFRED